LFPPLGLAGLAAFLPLDTHIELVDEHIETLTTEDVPDLVAIEVYITSAQRAYRIADLYRRRGCYVVLGGLHVTSCSEEAALHANTIFLGPGEDTWPRFLEDLENGAPAKRYESTERSLISVPPIRRDLMKRSLYLVPNSIVVSRGCPYVCDFCYKEAFFQGGKSFYTQRVDDALKEIDRLPGRHLYFLDDHLFGDRRFSSDLFAGMKGMGRIWQAAGTVNSILEARFKPRLLEEAVGSGLRSLFVGFETINPANLQTQRKFQNQNRDYASAIRRLHDLGVMINGSFVFGMDDDDPDVFDRTVEWAVKHGIETATFHILTPYPGTATFQRMESQARLLHRDWNLYDTRHTVFMPAKMTPLQLEEGYWSAYRNFYRWSNILKGASTKPTFIGATRHTAYAAGWKKFEPLWNLLIRAKHVAQMRPALEAILRSFGKLNPENGEEMVRPLPTATESADAETLIQIH
jgi:radical SAM superfamily enzyme YgiQ (UPF0313 family)